MTVDIKVCPICGNDLPDSFVTQDDREICLLCGYDASQEAKFQYLMTVVTVENGNLTGVSDGDKLPWDYTIILEAIPDQGYHFVKFIINGEDDTENPEEITVHGILTIEVVFEAD